MISRRQLEYHLEEVLHVRGSPCDLLSTLWAKLLVQAKPGERLKIKAVCVFHENSLASFADMVSVDTVEDLSWWFHLLKTNLKVGD